LQETELIELGKNLKKIRLANKIELTKIADRTKININFLKDMEAGKFDFLPELYVRSFLKLYLKELGPDAGHFLDEYDTIKGEKDLKVTIVTDEDLKNIKKPGQFRNQVSTIIEKLKPYLRQMNFIWLGIGALLILLVLFSLTRDNNQDQPIISAGSLDNSLLEPSKAIVDTSSGSRYVTHLFNNKPKNLNLELTALQRTWLQISVDDSMAKEHIFDAGMKHNWQAKDKFRLRIGNAAGIRLVLNGKDLGPLGQAGRVINIDVTKDGIQNRSL